MYYGIIKTTKGEKRMLTKERHDLILQMLKQKRAVTVTELTKELEASESTIRRDLSVLDKEKKLIKVHGGATALEDEFISFEADVATKSVLNIQEKHAVGKYAASLINKEDFVYIDAGTTTETMIDYIENNGAVFVTNGIAHARKLIQRGCKAYVIGGELKLSTEAIVGAEGVSNIKKYNFTKCFLGTNAIAVDQGFTTPDIEEALMKQEASKRSHITYVLADHTKFGRVSSVTFENLSDACVITDYVTEEKYKKSTIIKEVLK